MDAELGISKWAIAALVAAMIVVGTMGLVLRGGGPGLGGRPHAAGQRLGQSH